MSLVNPKLNSTAQISPAWGWGGGRMGGGAAPQPSCFLCRPLRLTGRPGVGALEWSICPLVGHVGLYACISCHRGFSTAAPVPFFCDRAPAGSFFSLSLFAVKAVKKVFHSFRP